MYELFAQGAQSTVTMEGAHVWFATHVAINGELPNAGTAPKAIPKPWLHPTCQHVQRGKAARRQGVQGGQKKSVQWF